MSTATTPPTLADLEARAARLEAAGGPRIRCADPDAMARFAELLAQAEAAYGLVMEAHASPLDDEESGECAG